MTSPLQKTVDWLNHNLRSIPRDIRMVYAESSEYRTPDQIDVASFGLFGFRQVPDGGFDPEDDDHAADLGEWDWEARPNCDFPEENIGAFDWLDVLREALSDPTLRRLANERQITLLFADHDGPVTVVE